MTSDVCWSFPAIPEATRDARDAIRELADRLGAGEQVREAMALCVTEAVANAAVHAYRDAPSPGKVVMEARRSDDDLCVYIRDDGRGLVPNPQSTGLGLGLPLMSQLADGFEVRTQQTGGTEIVLRFALAA